MCKVERLIDQFELDAPTNTHTSIEEYLEQRWTGADGKPAVGSGALTDTFNKLILRKKYADHNRNTYLVESEYPLITNTDESVERSELAADLKSDGLNIRRLKIHTVSQTTMWTHLHDCTSVTKDTDQWTEPTTPGRERRIHWAENYTEQKVGDTIRKLTNEGKLAHGTDAVISVNTDLICPECGKQVPVRDAIERGYVCPDHMVDDEDTETGPTGTTTTEDTSTSSTDESDTSSTRTLTETEPQT